MKGVLIANGDLKDHAFYKGLLHSEGYNWVVCADGGANKAHSMGIVPQVVVGDLDSISPKVRQDFEDKKVAFRIHPPAKDETDLELALRMLVEEGCNQIDLIGALGGRIDHELGNIFLLVELARQGVEGRILDERQTLQVLLHSKTFFTKIGALVSLIPLTPEVTNITLEGLEYPLKEETLTMGFARGVSNVALEERVSISFEQGILLVVEIAPQRDAN